MLTRVENRSGQLDMAKMARTLRHTLSTSLTLKVPINRSQPRIHQPAHLWLVGCFIHYFRMLDFRDRVGFLRDRGSDSERVTKATSGSLTISSGERIPNCTSLTLRIGAAEYANWWPSILLRLYQQISSFSTSLRQADMCDEATRWRVSRENYIL